MKVSFIVILIFSSVEFTLAQDLLSQQKNERLYRTGLELIDKNQFGAARESFQQFVISVKKGELKTTEAEYYLAFCALNLMHTDAEKLFSDFIADHPSHPKSVLAYYDMANFYYADKNYSKASVNFNKVDFSALPNDLQNIGRFRYGYCFLNLKSLKEALDQFNFIKAQGGQYGPAASYYAGFIEYSLNDLDNALTDFNRAEKSEAYAKVVPYLVANVYFKQKKYDDLLNYVSQLKSKTDLINQEEIGLLTAESYYKKGDYKSALPAFTGYLSGKEETADKGILFRAGYCAFLLKQDDEALKYLKLSFTDKDSIGYYSAYYLGSIYLKKQQKPMALTSFDIARKFKSDAKLVEESSFQFAKIAYELGNAGLAISDFESILKQFPNSSYTSEIKELLSQAYVNASNYNKAIEYIESLPKRSASVNRAYQKATMLKGLDFFNKEQFTEAIQFFDKSIQYPVDQDYLAEASFWNGESYSILKQYEQAIGSYQKIIALTGYDNIGILSTTRYGLGYCFFNLQQYDRALFNFKEFVNKASSNQQNLGDGLLRLADCYYVAKEYNEALKNYQKAISIKSVDSDYAHLQAGVVMGILRNYSESAVEFEVVIKSSTQIRFIEEAIFQLAQLNFEQGNYASAVAGYTKLLSTYPSSRFTPYSYTRRAAANYNLKEYNKTADDYITVLSRYPNHPANKDVLLPLQEALNLAGRSAEFDKYLAQYKSSNPDAKGIESVEFETAKNLYYNQDYSKAILRLGDYISQYPSSSRVNEANYYLAESYFRTKDVPKALGIYYLIQQDKAFLFANKVTGRIAELEFKQGNYDKAVHQYRQLSKVATNKKEQFAAWNGQLESYFLLAQYDSAKSYAEIILTNGSANATLASKATLYLGKIAKEKGDYETAKDEFLNTINSAHDEHGAEANYLMGELFYLTKQHSQCYTTLVSLNANFASYPEWVGKSYLLLSDNFIATNDIFNARAVLKSLVDNFPLENIKLVAKERLIKMDQAENKKQEKVKADTVDNEK